jgi:hypothetical protein
VPVAAQHHWRMPSLKADRAARYRLTLEAKFAKCSVRSMALAPCCREPQSMPLGLHCLHRSMHTASACKQIKHDGAVARGQDTVKDIAAIQARALAGRARTLAQSE